MPLRNAYLSSHRRITHNSPHQHHKPSDGGITINEIDASSRTSGSHHRFISNRGDMKRFCTVLLYLIGCTSIVILGYSLLLHHIVGDQKSTGSAGAGHLPLATHPIERPRTAVSFEDQLAAETGQSNLVVDRYNDHEFKLRSVREKIDRLTFVGHNQDEAERAASEHHVHHQPQQNVTTQHVHIFYRAPVPWYSNQV